MVQAARTRPWVAAGRGSARSGDRDERRLADAGTRSGGPGGRWRTDWLVVGRQARFVERGCNDFVLGKWLGLGWMEMSTLG